MRAWRLSAPGGSLTLEGLPLPEARPGSVLVRMEAVPILSYMGDYVAGKLPYRYPEGPFTPGTNGVGTVEAVGAGVYHAAPGQRVAVNPYFVADENVAEPVRVLVGLTGVSADGAPMLADWPDGTLAEHALMPASAVLPLDGLEGFAAERLAGLAKFAVPLGGLLRGRLAAGEVLVVNGASGYFGSAAVLLGLALGAARVVAAAGEGAAAALTGDADADAAALRLAAGGPADAALDMVGKAGDPNGTLAALKALRRGGRLVLMGSMTVPLPLPYGDVLLNDLEIIGNFMYRPAAYRTLVALVRAGRLDLDAVRPRTFALEDLPAAMAAAASMRGLDATIVRPVAGTDKMP